MLGFLRLSFPLILIAVGLLVAAVPDHKSLEPVGYFEKNLD
jgi:hypothetical protein